MSPAMTTRDHLIAAVIAAVIAAWFARTPEPIDERVLTAAAEAAEEVIQERIG